MRFLGLLMLLFSSNLMQSQSLDIFFNDADQFLSTYVNTDGKVNYTAVKSQHTALENLVKTIKTIDISGATPIEQKAFSINAYNIMVIHRVISHYPISSVRKIRGFFKSPVIIAGVETNFDLFEKSLKPKNDPRLHMALVCAANSCPILLHEAYKPATLEDQLDKASRISLSKKHMVSNQNNGLELSKIFEWYEKDFASVNGVISFINKYSEQKYKSNKIYHMPYDWALNDESFDIIISKTSTLSTKNKIPATQTKSKVNKDVDHVYTDPNTYKSKTKSPTTTTTVTADKIVTSKISNPITTTSTASEGRYIVSSLYDRGEWDLNFFNNYYIETKRDFTTEDIKSRSIFLTNYLQLIYGINKRINVGLDLKFRSVTQSVEKESSTTKALRYGNKGKEFSIDGKYTGYSTVGLTAIGPKIKILPFRSVPKFSIQSTFFVPLIKSQTNNKIGYIDWENPTWNTQFFYDHDITKKVSLFTEIDFIVENINKSVFLKGDGGYSQISTPASLILSYFPNNDMTVYLLYNSTPKWNNYVPNVGKALSSYDPYSQYGVGLKYFVTNKLQAEVIYTKFHSGDIEKTAHTFNFGLRYFGSK